MFPCEVWEPEGEPAGPLIVDSHPSLFHRRVATFLCRHLASHGYTMAAMDHSEVVLPALGRQPNETAEARAARMDAMIASRVPDVRLLLQHFPDAAPVGIVGHSFGGRTALASPGAEARIRAVVALAPGGSSERKPGILPLMLAFQWGRDVPTLLVAAENDCALPLPGMHEIFGRIPSTRHFAVLRRADPRISWTTRPRCTGNSARRPCHPSWLRYTSRCSRWRNGCLKRRHTMSRAASCWRTLTPIYATAGST